MTKETCKLLDHIAYKYLDPVINSEQAVANELLKNKQTVEKGKALQIDIDLLQDVFSDIIDLSCTE